MGRSMSFRIFVYIRNQTKTEWFPKLRFQATEFTDVASSSLRLHWNHPVSYVTSFTCVHCAVCYLLEIHFYTMSFLILEKCVRKSGRCFQSANNFNNAFVQNILLFFSLLSYFLFHFSLSQSTEKGFWPLAFLLAFSEYNSISIELCE